LNSLVLFIWGQLGSNLTNQIGRATYQHTDCCLVSQQYKDPTPRAGLHQM